MKKFLTNTEFMIGLIGVFSIAITFIPQIGNSEPGYIITWGHVNTSLWVFGFFLFMGVMAGLRFQKDNKRNLWLQLLNNKEILRHYKVERSSNFWLGDDIKLTPRETPLNDAELIRMMNLTSDTTHKNFNQSL